MPDIPHNLISGGGLVDAGCSIKFYKYGAEIEYEVETLDRGWRDKPTRLWTFDITSKCGNRVTLDTAPEEYDPSNGGVFATIKHCVNSIYECTNKEQLIKYYHASLGSHPKTTLIEAAKAGYLKGCPGMDSQAIRKCIGVEEATEMGHMKQTQQGIKSTTIKSRRVRPAKITQQSDRTNAMHDAISVPTQEPKNRKTNMVFMLVQRPEGFIASDQTRKFPRMSNRGMQYICVFYIHNPNYIKGIPIKIRKMKNF